MMNDSELKELFNAIPEEMSHVEDRTNRRFDKLDNTLSTMQHEINACKLERESVSLLIKKIDQLERRIEILESKTA